MKHYRICPAGNEWTLQVAEDDEDYALLPVYQTYLTKDEAQAEADRLNSLEAEA
jgi:predicted anti-sigma-YlaC factor YlaD